MLSFLRTKINAKHIDIVIKLASFDNVKQFRNLSGKVNLFTESILHLLITSWVETFGTDVTGSKKEDYGNDISPSPPDYMDILLT